jgi:selenocysteine lyase/cysteine desulfurase
MIKSQRHLFDIPENIAYFNCAYNSPSLKESTNRLHVGVDTKSRPWERTPASFFDDAETVRQLCADLFGGSLDAFAVVPSASYGISTASRVIEPYLTKEHGIIVIEEEFPSVVLPMKRIAQETGAKLITVKLSENGDWTQAIKERLDNKVKVVAISLCHWTNGAYIDLPEIRKACNETDSILIVDATQALGAIPVSIDIIRPDFLVAAGYKWLLCPYGFSLLYVDEKWRNERPLEESWIARENAEDFANLVRYSDKYMRGSRRFDVGEKCTPTILPGAIAALEQIKKWGIEEIANSLSVINEKIISHLNELGFQLPDETQRCPHMFGATIPLNYKGNLVNDLKKRYIYKSTG